jgi:hypothetical protein
MHSERGQASVEWIVLLLLLALGLAALVRFAPRADAGHLGAELVSHVTCAARGCARERGARPRGGERTPGGTRGRLVTVPPLVPVMPRHGRATGPDARPSLRPPRSARPLILRAGRRAGALWRRSWALCLGYERVRYSVLHPEIRFPHQTIPVSEDLRIANDCLSPVDLVRDFGRPPKP